MKLLRANQASEKLINNFLKNNTEINKTSLLESGYVVQINHSITGCFTLEPIGDDLYWLKQLYITRTEAIKLPYLVEAVLALALQKKAKKVYVRSHKLMLDIILESLQFQQEKASPIQEAVEDAHGKWWSYNISS